MKANRHFIPITSSAFRYYSSVDTDLRRTFKRVRRRMNQTPVQLTYEGPFNHPKWSIKETA